MNKPDHLQISGYKYLKKTLYDRVVNCTKNWTVHIFIRYSIKILTAGLFFLSYLHPAVSQTINQRSYLSIDQVIDNLENKFPVHFFYKPEWFENKNFQSSILRLSLDETLDQIKT